MATITIPDQVATEVEARALPRLDANANGILMSPEEFDAIDDYDECYRYELIRGVVIVNPIPVDAQSDPNEELGRLLRNYQEDHPEGHRLDKTMAERYVPVPGGTRRQPDRILWCGLGRLPRWKTDVPAIIVELVSGRRRDWKRDYVDKRQEYAAIGVREYWIFDRFQRTLTVFFPDGGQRIVAENEVYESPILPGFPFPLRRLLEITDAWDQQES